MDLRIAVNRKLWSLRSKSSSTKVGIQDFATEMLLRNKLQGLYQHERTYFLRLCPPDAHLMNLLGLVPRLLEAGRNDRIHPTSSGTSETGTDDVEVVERDEPDE